MVTSGQSLSVVMGSHHTVTLMTYKGFAGGLVARKRVPRETVRFKCSLMNERTRLVVLYHLLMAAQQRAPDSMPIIRAATDIYIALSSESW
jgi:hypothetical protein